MEDYFAVPIEHKPQTILDIGANIGAFALRAHQQWPNAKITCYEPMPFNLEVLREHVDAKWCRVEPYAVREFTGEDDIYVGDMFVTGGFKKGARQSDNKITVTCISATTLPSCELVKVDTEGCEVEIIKNLDLKKTQVVMLEHHSKADATEIKGLLAASFNLIHDETDHDVGTEIFVRKAIAI